MQRLERRSVAYTRKHAATSPRRGGQAWLAQISVAAVFAAAAVLISLVYWPGSLDDDTLAEMQEAATGHYSDWHTPVLDWLWRPLYLMGIHGPGWLLPVDIFTLLLGFYLILRVRFSRPVSTLIALVCCVFPPVLTWAVHIGVDAWFAASMIAAFGFAARAARTTGRGRTVSIVAAVWFAFIATAARHNALPAVLALFIVLAALSLRDSVRHRKLVACSVGVLATLAVLGVQTGIQHSIETKGTHPIQGTYIYDLAQLSKQEHRVLFPPSIDPGQSLATIDKDTSVRLVNALVFGKNPPVKFQLRGRQFDTLQRARLEVCAGEQPDGLSLGT